MTRTLSFLLVAIGLLIAGAGVQSVWISWNAEKQSEAQWETQIAKRPPTVTEALPVRRGEMLARLSINRLNSQWIVVEGADRKELKLGPGHLADTALPGSPGNCVIAGHRDTQFRALRNIQVGEEIGVERGGATFIYRVTETQVVAPTDTSSLDPTPNSTLTLVTCYPFYYVGPAPKRFVVRAKLVETRTVVAPA